MSKSPLWIPSTRLPPPFRILVYGILVVPVVLYLSVWATGTLPLIGIPFAVLDSVGIAGLMLVFCLAVLQNTWPRAIAVDSGGVSVRRLFGGVRLVAWDQIRTELQPPTRGFLGLRYRPIGGKDDRWYALNLEQARSMLFHPSAPGWLGSKEVLDSWGLPQRLAPE